MKHPAPSSVPSRRTILKAVALALTGRAGAVSAQLLGRVPRPVSDAEPVYDIRGTVTVNGVPATQATRIGPGDTVETGARSRFVFVSGTSAFLARENTSFVFDTTKAGLRVLTGALLSVFGPGSREVATQNVILGIRGTGVYFEVHEDRTYVCVCYGTVDLSPTADRSRGETIVSRHHDAPRYVLASGDSLITPAPVINHTDQELAMLEALVGRTPPFGVFDQNYGTPAGGY